MSGGTGAPAEALPRTVAEAERCEQEGRPLRFLFFWGHRPPRDGGVGAGCLSQWWEAPFEEDGHVFRTAEHYMMAHKAWLFGDGEIAGEVLAAGHPGEAKRLGRRVRGFDEESWERERYGIVVRGNAAKFRQHPPLRAFLTGTRKCVLVEASPVDRVWGIGLAAGDEAAARPSRWRGLNLLGFALMDVRDLLAAG
ncbi:NADAR family protein [Streptomyces sp. RFCAC02]|uniref:NADAR family protein n=1 Tax=Streptomyces sp. RFCAC02 TaxID=2499143 RepID=UPI00101FA290|nr:NADAR family protein [Streptomyces sp. RFCAC02]